MIAGTSPSFTGETLGKPLYAQSQQPSWSTRSMRQAVLYRSDLRASTGFRNDVANGRVAETSVARANLRSVSVSEPAAILESMGAGGLGQHTPSLPPEMQLKISSAPTGFRKQAVLSMISLQWGFPL